MAEGKRQLLETLSGHRLVYSFKILTRSKFFRRVVLNEETEERSSSQGQESSLKKSKFYGIKAFSKIIPHMLF